MTGTASPTMSELRVARDMLEATAEVLDRLDGIEDEASAFLRSLTSRLERLETSQPPFEWRRRNMLPGR